MLANEQRDHNQMKKSFYFSEHLAKAIDPQYQADDYPVISVPGPVIDIRVEWLGQDDRLGTFQVDTAGAATGETWENCTNLAGKLPANDFLIPQAPGTGTLTLRFQRGPTHTGRRFKVRALPVRWIQPKPKAPHATRVVVRGQDYVYQADSEQAAWHESTLVDGVQIVEVSLAHGSDYEIWTNLQHPTNDDAWLPQDPLVDHGGSDPA